MQIQSATRVLCVAIALHTRGGFGSFWKMSVFVGMRLNYFMILGFNIIEGCDFLFFYVCMVAAAFLCSVVLVVSGC